jgi:polysaccharide biosynthesis protein PslH
MKILFITDYLPYPPISGDRIRVYNLMRIIAREHEVSIAALLGTPDDQESISNLNHFCHLAYTAGYQWPNPLFLLAGLIRYTLSGRPMDLRLMYYEKLANKILELMHNEHFDIIQIEHSRMALYLEVVKANVNSCPRTVLMLHNVAHEQSHKISRVELNPIKKFRARLNNTALRHWEPRYAERFDRCVAVSDLDKALLLRDNPRLRIDIVPNGVDTKLYRPLDQPQNKHTLLFIGTMHYQPCADGAIYFCQRILPIIRKKIHDIETWIVGAEPPPEVVKLGSEHIHVTGRVPDILPYYRQCSVCVVPLRAGGGTRLKILEAMALGRPVISTSIGCEGLDVKQGRHILVADDPEKFAEASIRLLTDEGLYRSIVSEARQLVEHKYDWESIAGHLLMIYKEMAAS